MYVFSCTEGWADGEGEEIEAGDQGLKTVWPRRKRSSPPGTACHAEFWLVAQMVPIFFIIIISIDEEKHVSQGSNYLGAETNNWRRVVVTNRARLSIRVESLLIIIVRNGALRCKFYIIDTHKHTHIVHRAALCEGTSPNRLNWK